MKERTENWVRPIICGLAIAFMVWLSKYLWESGRMKIYIVDFITTFSPIIVGLLAFFIYWIVRDYKKRRQSNKDIEKWIGYFSFKDEKGSYSDLKGKIKRYIQEELEIESARRIEPDRTIGEKINKLENNMNEVNKAIDLVNKTIALLIETAKIPPILPGGPGRR